MKVKLSDRIRPNSEVLPWIYEEIKLLENQLDEKLTRIEALRVAVKEAYVVLNKAAKETEIICGDDDGGFGCQDDEVPTDLAKQALEAIAKLQPILNK